MTRAPLLRALAALCIAGAAALAPTTATAAPANHTTESHSGYSFDSGARFTLTVTWYSCSHLTHSQCPADFTLTVYDVHPDSRGPIANVNYGDYYTHLLDGNGHHTVVRSRAGYEADYLDIELCNGGTRSEPNNCKDYTYFSPL
jgi:hypothetical protein